MKMCCKLYELISVAAVVGALLLASCSTLPSEGPIPPATSGTSATAAKPYGSLTIAGVFALGHIDPQQGGYNQHVNLGTAVFDTLVYADDKGQLSKPGIAERWEISPDGRTHTFYIRKGVKFHNGDDLTGADVKFSIERMMAPEGTNSDVSIWRAAVASVELKDTYVVALHLKQPQFELLPGVDSAWGETLPKKYIEEKGADYFRSHYVGSGPFRVVSHVPMTQLELEALDSHWRPAPKFKNITVLSVPEEATKVAMLKTGELDVAAVSPDSVPALKSAGLRIKGYDGGAQVMGYAFYDLENPEKYALGDVRVRKAMQLGINSKEIADKILGGYGEPYYTYAVNPAYFSPNLLKPDPYDPEGAKKLLTEAGYPSGFNTRLWDVLVGELNSTMNQAVSGFWRKIGVNAEVVAMAYSSVSKMYNPKHQPQIWNSYMLYPGTAPREIEKVGFIYHSGGAAKNISNPKLDEVLDKVPTLSDPVERKRLAYEAVVLAKNEYTVLAVVSPYNVLALGSKIGDVSPVRGTGITALMFETITHAK